MSKRGGLTLLGFILFMTGILSLVLEMVGLQFGILAWVEYLGRVGAFLFKILIIIVGMIIVTLANSNEDAYDEYFDGDKYEV